jgi:hypothetical protein
MKFVRNEGSKTFFYNSADATDGLLYDFDVPQGGQWKIKMTGSYWPFDSLTVRVDTIIDRAVSGVTVPAQLVSFYGVQGQFLGQDSVFKNVGGTFNLFLFNSPNPDSAVDASESCRLHCLKRPNDFPLNFYGYDCIISNTDERLSDAGMFSIFPNPTYGDFSISFKTPTSPNARLEILDATGRSVLKSDIPAGVNEWDVSIENLTDGLYFVKYDSGGKGMGIRRFVVVE